MYWTASQERRKKRKANTLDHWIDEKKEPLHGRQWNSLRMYQNSDRMWHGTFPVTMKRVALLDLAPNLWFVCSLVADRRFVAMNSCKLINNCMDIEHTFYPVAHFELATNDFNSNIDQMSCSPRQTAFEKYCFSTYCRFLTLKAFDHMLLFFARNINHGRTHPACHHRHSTTWSLLKWWWHFIWADRWNCCTYQQNKTKQNQSKQWTYLYVKI